MKTNKLTILFAFVLLSTLAFAQPQKDYAFKVLANKGANEVKSGDTWQPLRTGASLKSTDELKLADNAYIGLVHANGKPMELKTAGVHKVKELETKIGSGTSVLNKYTDFILSSNSAEAKKNRLSATGAVHRDVDAAAIKLLLPENQHSGIYSNAAVINWDGTKAQGPYVVILRNMFDDELARFETPETQIEIDLADPKFASENAILVEVSSKVDPKQASKQHLVKRLTPAEQEKIKVSLGEIMGEVSEETALNKLILAGFFEEQNLFIDAISAYEDAIKLAPDVPSYKEAYEEFLLRHGLKK
ncbi:MAG TPA: hypothetical protein VD927_07610 [Chryseosolibacter sp.]|nr:hypothetical protein [Chryseosolibacter sp.]